MRYTNPRLYFTYFTLLMLSVALSFPAYSSQAVSEFLFGLFFFEKKLYGRMLSRQLKKCSSPVSSKATNSKQFTGRQFVSKLATYCILLIIEYTAVFAV